MEKLKFYLKSKNQPVNGRKEELIDRAMDFITRGWNNYPRK